MLAIMFVMCEQTVMTPTTTDLARSAGISKSYASEILSGKRAPSRPLAIHILRATGWVHDSIATLSEEQILVLEQVEQWRPVSERAA
jgi:transcriptional regulator with XRE-family HTH domain